MWIGKVYGFLFGIVLSHSLRNARIRDDGFAVWEEDDHCTPPLAQERATALDRFFERLSVTPVHAGEGWKTAYSMRVADARGRRLDGYGIFGALWDGVPRRIDYIFLNRRFQAEDVIRCQIVLETSPFGFEVSDH